MRKLIIIVVAISILGLVITVAAQWQPTVYLMPTPAVMKTGALNPFDINPNLEKGNKTQVFYATNRIPAGGKEYRTYTIFPGNKLSIGIAHMQIGKAETTWQQIMNFSTSAENRNRPALSLIKIEELAQFPLNGGMFLPESMRVLADTVNRALEQSIDKNLTIYVHGANSSIYRASAQAAQYQHFTGQNSVVLAFLWPSAENLLAYGTDTRHAARSAPAFARLLTMLAEHTDAQSINILAYSAGAQILSPALDIIGRNTGVDKRKALRLGEVYFAASDIGVGTFVKHLQSYIDMPRSTTLAINRGDSVLAFSAIRNRESRIGRPDRDDLSPIKDQWIRNASMEPALSIIGVSAGTVPGMSSRSHDFWYSHPWVSSDILTQFLFHKSPGTRGLTETASADGLHYWLFPPDYPDRIIDVVKQAVEAKQR